MIETGDEVQRVLDGSWVSLCLDTGHLLIGGTDPAELARQAPERIAHAHLKDVDARLAERVQDGAPDLHRRRARGHVPPARDGRRRRRQPSSDHLRARGYDGWYVLEQDTILTEEPRGEGPVADVRASAEYLRSVLRGTR